MGYIYKITNIVSGSVYIGQTKVDDPYDRFKAHLSNARRGVGCPALTDAIISYGEDKFKFEVLIICFNTDIDYYEIEYIEKYNSMVPNGYNILKGGQCGGGFKGKKHRQEVIEQFSKKLKERYEKNPEERIKSSNRVKQYYENNPEARKKTSESIKNSEKWKKAIEEGRVGGKGIPKPEETKEKIRQSLKKYYETHDVTTKTVNREKHRQAIVKAVGVKVGKFSLDGTFTESYPSIADAAKSCGVYRNAICQALDKPTSSSCGFRWKTLKEETKNTEN